MGKDGDALSGWLRPAAAPVVVTEQLLAIEEVRLAAGDVARAVLVEFYERVLGLTLVRAEGEREGALRFIHLRRRIVLERRNGGAAVGIELGRVGLLVKDFGETLVRLRDRRIGFEMLHTDGGLTRMAIVRDPAGNWVHLVETRPF